jgi:hypothetical protein
MPNTKAVGVAYSDPEFDSVSVTGAITAPTITSTATTSAVVANATAGLYFLTTAITANTTTTSAPKGSIGTTSNATGAGKLFVSDGSKWQFAVVA